jgi:steroid delta-isomerase-like uncharacterized protein
MMMTREQMLAFSRRELDEVWTGGKVAMVHELYAPDAVDHNPMPQVPPGTQGLSIFVGLFAAAFSERRFTVVTELVDGDKVARQWSFTGKHTGEFLGIPATGRAVTMTGIDILRVVNGRCTEIWHNEDVATLMQQLGAPR